MPTDRYLRTSQVLQLVPITRQTLHRWIRDGRFPASRQIGPAGGAVGFLESEVNEWLKARAIAVGPDGDNADAAGK